MDSSSARLARQVTETDTAIDRATRPQARCLVSSGHPRFLDPEMAAIAREHGIEAAWLLGWTKFGTAVLTQAAGDFAVAIRSDDRRTFLAVDRFSVRTLCYRLQDGEIQVAERADALAGDRADINLQACFDYLYFHVIPAPRTIFTEVSRVPAGHYVLFDDGDVTVSPWWTPSFEEHNHAPFSRLRDEFRRLLYDAVSHHLQDGKVGCFLSGGTDSSTVAGMLTEITGPSVPTFSIGFDAEGYDEMEYARLAAQHFGTQHHEYYLTPEDLVRAIPSVAASYDQPFGNSSVLPAYFCARMAKDHGIERLVAGDGGDELFGGNTRYAKQRVFEVYQSVPGFLRRGLLEPLLHPGAPLASLPGLGKVASYIDQARVPMPARLQTYNLLTRIGLGEVLTPDFLAHVDTEEPMRQQAEVYQACHARSLVNRMLAFDWKYTLADADLPKVVGATSLAQVPVGFPLLDDRLVDFSLRLAPELKLKRLRLRWFFKEALRGFLPNEILTKKKHGFGLPFGVWLTRHDGLRSLAMGSLDLLRGRGLVREDFLDRVMRDLLPSHPGYYGEMVWILMMLAQWLEHRGSGRGAAA